MKHHYLPKFYLSSFIRLGESMVYVYDLIRDKYLHQKPIKVAVINNYYGSNPVIENKILSGIETNAKIVIDKIDSKKHDIINNQDKYNLSCFLSTLFLRVPNYEENYNKFIDQFHKLVFKFTLSNKEVTQSQIRVYKRETGNDISEEDLLYLNQNLDDFEFKHTSDQRAIDIIIQLKKISQLLYCMEWTIVYAFPHRSFITTDNPFTFSPPPKYLNNMYSYGIITRGVQKCIPLSQYSCLIINDVIHNHRLNISYCEGSDKIMKNINYWLASNSKS